MHFGIDFLFLLLLIGCFFLFRKRSLFRAAASLIGYIVGFVVALLACRLLAEPVCRLWVYPIVEKSVASELASLDSLSPAKTPLDTVSSLPIAEWVREKPAPFVEFVEKHGYAVDELSGKTPAEVLNLLSSGGALNLSRAAIFLLFLILICLLAKVIALRMEANRPIAPKPSGFKKVFPVLLTVILAFLYVETVALLIIWLVPYGYLDSVFFDSDIFEQTVIYRFSPIRFIASFV